MKNPQQSYLMQLIQEYADARWLEGILMGMKNSAEYALYEAGEEFKKDNDQTAILYRHIFFEIKKNANSLEAEQKPKLDKRKEQAYSEIVGILEALEERTLKVKSE